MFAEPALLPLQPFHTMALAETIAWRRREGLPVYRFDLGEPSRGVHEAVSENLAAALRTQSMGYTPSCGVLALRQGIAAWYADRYGVTVDPARILVTTGASAALLLALMAAFDETDLVATPAPGYPAYRNMLTALRLPQILLDCGMEHGFKLTAEALRQSHGGISGTILASPANPTGVMLTPQEIDDLLCVARERSIRLVSDEIYHGLTWGTAERTLAAEPDVLVVSSFSKLWRMTGWRLGWLVAPLELVETLESLSQNLFLCPPAISQFAAMEALKHTREAISAGTQYDANRAMAEATLQRLGIARYARPDGAFYLYFDVSAFTDDSLAWTKQLLEETGVAVAPGIDFDPVRGRHWARFALGGNQDSVEAGLAVFERWATSSRRYSSALIRREPAASDQ